MNNLIEFSLCAKSCCICQTDVDYHDCLQADENLRLIRPALTEAVDCCIDAAGHEFDIGQQRTLLKAAAFGLPFCRFEKM